MITLTASPWIENQEQLALTTDALPVSCTPHKILLENWLTPWDLSKVLEEPYHHSSVKEPYSGNGRKTYEHNTSSLDLTLIMLHRANEDC